jgi:hypothetical protein
MFEAPKNNSYGAKYYGTAAISQALGGGDWMAEGCGKCWKVRGWSNIPNKDTFQTTLVLKGTNYCPPSNPACSGNKAHFDIAAPGFDVTEYSLSNTCAVREAAEIEGFKSCGRWLIDDPNSDIGCDCSKFKDPVLRAGCDNFFSLLWDNSQVDYEEVDCPVELSRLNCWEENGGGYPNGVPEFCASNIGETAPTPPVDPPAPTPTPPVNPPVPIPTPPVNPPEPSPVNPPTPSTDGCCTWNNGETCGGEWCNASQSNCEEGCSGTYIGGSPIAPPVVSPVESPVASEEYCCSDDLKVCKEGWCNLSEDNCANCSAHWILKNPVCELKNWEDCMNNQNGCCPPAICQNFGSWAQCRVQ